ncbi:MAG: hypothetical protein JOZ52_08425, partial [Acidobacteria bacterium]|nr:hypothetical protein [Acidobacteriota bacterium]
MVNVVNHSRARRDAHKRPTWAAIAELLPRTLPRVTGLRDDAPVMSRTVQQSLLALAFTAAALVVATAAPRPHEPARPAPAIEDPAGAMATFHGALSRAA